MGLDVLAAQDVKPRAPARARDWGLRKASQALVSKPHALLFGLSFLRPTLGPGDHFGQGSLRILSSMGSPGIANLGIFKRQSSQLQLQTSLGGYASSQPNHGLEFERSLGTLRYQLTY